MMQTGQLDLLMADNMVTTQPLKLKLTGTPGMPLMMELADTLKIVLYNLCH